MFKTKHSIIKPKYLLVKNYLDMNPPKNQLNQMETIRKRPYTPT